MEVGIDDDTLKKSRRCPPAVCSSIRETVGIDIESHGAGDYEVVLVEDAQRAEELYSSATTVKLFYQEHENTAATRRTGAGPRATTTMATCA